MRVLHANAEFVCETAVLYMPPVTCARILAVGARMSKTVEEEAMTMTMGEHESASQRPLN